jgi:hypothetical protein
MTHTELELCARFLGEPYECNVHGTFLYAVEGDEGTRFVSDADLLLALLMRAAELGLYPEIWRAGDCWGCVFEHDFGGATDTSGPTPLAAMIQAVVKYQEGRP